MRGRDGYGAKRYRPLAEPFPMRVRFKKSGSTGGIKKVSWGNKKIKGMKVGGETGEESNARWGGVVRIPAGVNHCRQERVVNEKRSQKNATQGDNIRGKAR